MTDDMTNAGPIRTALDRMKETLDLALQERLDDDALFRLTIEYERKVHEYRGIARDSSLPDEYDRWLENYLMRL